MNIRFRCPRCQQVASLHRLEGSAIACPACGWQRPLPHAGLSEGRLSECLCCGCPDLWRQKDFPQRVGLGLVACGAIASTIAVVYYRPNLALAILMAFALMDLLLYWLMPDVLVCYRCGARFRDQTPQREIPAFNLDIAERYRQEQSRLAESRDDAPSGPALTTSTATPSGSDGSVPNPLRSPTLRPERQVP